MKFLDQLSKTLTSRLYNITLLHSRQPAESVLCKQDVMSRIPPRFPPLLSSHLGSTVTPATNKKRRAHLQKRSLEGNFVKHSVSASTSQSNHHHKKKIIKQKKNLPSTTKRIMTTVPFEKKKKDTESRIVLESFSILSAFATEDGDNGIFAPGAGATTGVSSCQIVLQRSQGSETWNPSVVWSIHDLGMVFSF